MQSAQLRKRNLKSQRIKKESLMIAIKKAQSEYEHRPSSELNTDIINMRRDIRRLQSLIQKNKKAIEEEDRMTGKIKAQIKEVVSSLALNESRQINVSPVGTASARFTASSIAKQLNRVVSVRAHGYEIMITRTF